MRMTLLRCRTDCVARDLLDLLRNHPHLRCEHLVIRILAPLFFDGAEVLDHTANPSAHLRPGLLHASLEEVVDHRRDDLEILDDLLGVNSVIRPVHLMSLAGDTANSAPSATAADLLAHGGNLGLHVVDVVAGSSLHVLRDAHRDFLDRSHGARKAPFGAPTSGHPLRGGLHFGLQLHVLLQLRILPTGLATLALALPACDRL
mmetsp:Transcript_77132/g.223221  ORF Transcript_77132/g.223221 Transcript_77132/m.223221 type:complete len:203 (+) Transcript_77132:1302-1910(+)